MLHGSRNARRFNDHRPTRVWGISRRKEKPSSGAIAKCGAILIVSVCALSSLSYWALEEWSKRIARAEESEETYRAATAVRWHMSAIFEEAINLTRSAPLAAVLTDPNASQLVTARQLLSGEVFTRVRATTAMVNPKGEVIVSVTSGAAKVSIRGAIEAIASNEPVIKVASDILEIALPIRDREIGRARGCLVIRWTLDDLLNVIKISTGSTRLASLVPATSHRAQTLSDRSVGTATSKESMNGLSKTVDVALNGHHIALKIGFDPSQTRTDALIHHWHRWLIVLSIGIAVLGMKLLSAVLRAALAPMDQLMPLARRVAFVESTVKPAPIGATTADTDVLSRAFNILLDRVKQMQEEIAESEEGRREADDQDRRLAQVVQNLRGIAFGSWCSGSQRVDCVSESIEGIFGRPQAELLTHQLRWLSMFHEDDRRVLAAIAAGESRPEQVECRITVGGQMRHVKLRLGYVESPEGEIRRIVFSIEDATPQQDREDCIRLLGRALSRSRIGEAIFECKPTGAKRALFCNAAFVHITGYSLLEINRRGWLQQQIQEIELGGAPPFLREDGEPADYLGVHRSRRLGGDLIWLEMKVSPIEKIAGTSKFLVSVSDVTAMRQLEHQLRERTLHLDSIAALSLDGFLAIDESGHVVYANQAFADLFGLRKADLGKMNEEQLLKQINSHQESAQALEFSSVEFGQSVLTNQQQELDTGRPPYSSQAIRITMNEVQRTLLVSVRSVMRGTSAKVVYVRDVTEDVRLDEMKREFLETAAHELRAPMANVMGFAKLLLERTADEKAVTEYLSIIHNEASRLTELVNDILDLARLEAGRSQQIHFELVSVGPFMSNLIRSIHGLCEGRSVRYEDKAASVQIRADKEQLARAVVNLISNAVKFSSAPSPISIRVDALPEGRCVILVEDHGIGMSPDQLSHIFERFYRADPKGEVPGTGLGMTLVKQIVELHGGEVVVDSTPGKGTRVSLILPLAVDSPAA